MCVGGVPQRLELELLCELLGASGVRAKAEQLAQCLAVDPEPPNDNDEDGQLRSVLKAWLSSEGPSLQALCAALKTMDEDAVAETVTNRLGECGRVV